MLEFDALSVASLLSRYLSRDSESGVQLSEISMADPSISILKENPKEEATPAPAGEQRPASRSERAFRVTAERGTAARVASRSGARRSARRSVPGDEKIYEVYPASSKAEDIMQNEIVQ